MTQQLTDLTTFDALYAEREAALAAWDATAYNAADAKISALRAAVNAECNLGLRAPFFHTVSVGGAA